MNPTTSHDERAPRSPEAPGGREEAGLSLRIEVGELRGSRLVEDYLAGSARALPFFSGHPRQVESYRRKLAEVGSRFGRAERERVAASVRPTSEAAARRLARFVEEGGAVVTTGQQTGFLTGPLYTIHKILTAIRLAETLETALGTVVLPVFWCASEDHDFAEANHAYLVGRDGRLECVAVAATDPRPLPMSEMLLGEDVGSTLATARKILGDERISADIINQIVDAYRPGVTVAAAFRTGIERLFAEFPLLVTDAADPHLKAASLPVLQADVDRAERHERVLREATSGLEAAGYPGQVAILPHAANVFYHGPAGRERLVRVGESWAAREAKERFTPDELDARMRAEPGRFSPNVLLRPVVESAVFPTLAYVGGPGEIAYFAQVKPLFEAYDILPPVAFPRLSVRLVPAEVAEAQAALGVSEAELAAPLDELATGLARRRLDGAVQERLARLREVLVDGFGAVIDAAHAIDPNLDRAVGARRDRALLAVAAAEDKIVAHARKHDVELNRALPLVRNHLRPLGKPQERVLNMLPFLARHPRLLHDIAGQMAIELAGPPVAAGAERAPGAAPVAGAAGESSL